jgi:OOP family OmpA-OmpF porin
MKSVNSFFCFFIVLLLGVQFSYGQSRTNKWKALFAIGVNSPSQSGFVEEFEGNSINFPTITIGVQHLFKRQLGAKLDFGYNRFVNADNTPEFKVNYTRINAQVVYDAKQILTFLPNTMSVVGHAGPGFSMIKPLGFYTDNKTSFLNVMGGLEFHYAVSKTLSVFIDTSYIYGFSKDFDPITSGYGSFNGNLFTATIGLSVSLSGCQYCN